MRKSNLHLLVGLAILAFVLIDMADGEADLFRALFEQFKLFAGI